MIVDNCSHRPSEQRATSIQPAGTGSLVILNRRGRTVMRKAGPPAAPTAGKRADEVHLRSLPRQVGR
jgi:hypothetical protein